MFGDGDARPVSDADAQPQGAIEPDGVLIVRVTNGRGEPVTPEWLAATALDGSHPANGFDFGRVDGEPELQAAVFRPGLYTVDVRADGYENESTKPVRVRRGERTFLHVRLNRPREP